MKASLAPTIGLGQAVQSIEAELGNLLPENVRSTWTGTARELLEANQSALGYFLLSLFVVYLVLAAQFESFVPPFIIMLTVPLAVTGALLTLFLLGSSLNVYSQIALVLLIGLVTKNGILIVEYANQRFNDAKKEGQSISVAQAVQEAALIRFRPILMTACSTVFGVLPLALSFGAGSESRQPMGLAIIGGMVFASFLTLFVIPNAYKAFNKRLENQAI